MGFTITVVVAANAEHKSPQEDKPGLVGDATMERSRSEGAAQQMLPHEYFAFALYLRDYYKG